MYLRNSKWSMTRRRRPINWFRIIVLLILIAIALYVQQVVVPTINPPFVPTPTATRDPATYVTEAQAAFESGKLLLAIDTYNQAIQVKPDDAISYIALARVQVYAGQYEEAVVSAQRAILLNSGNSLAHAILGWAYLKQNDYENAERSIVRSLELDPNNGIAHAFNAELLGGQYLENIGPMDAITIASEESKTAINLAPNSLEAHRARGYILYITANYEEAAAEYATAININPNIPELHIDLGLTYRALGLTEDAVQEYTLANTLNPTDIRPNLYASRALASVGSYGQAAQYAESAVLIDPTDPYLRANWGVMLYKNVDLPAAVAQLALAIEGGITEDGQTVTPLVLAPGDDRTVEAYYFYVLALAYTRRCDLVLTIAQQIMSTVPLDETAVYNANAALEICQASLLTPSPTTISTGTPETTPTP